MSQTFGMPATNRAIGASPMRSGAQGTSISGAAAETVAARYPRTGMRAQKTLSGNPGTVAAENSNPNPSRIDQTGAASGQEPLHCPGLGRNGRQNADEPRNRKMHHRGCDERLHGIEIFLIKAIGSDPSRNNINPTSRLRYQQEHRNHANHASVRRALHPCHTEIPGAALGVNALRRRTPPLLYEPTREAHMG